MVEASSALHARNSISGKASTGRPLKRRLDVVGYDLRIDLALPPEQTDEVSAVRRGGFGASHPSDRGFRSAGTGCPSPEGGEAAAGRIAVYARHRGKLQSRQI